MKKVWMVVSLLGWLFCCGSLAVAGGVDNKQNFSAAYVGSASRNAATDGADTAAYNPAGIMQMANGAYVELDAQYLNYDYDHTLDGSTLDASNQVVVPTAFGIYKKNKWAAFGSFTINGGGGEVEYENGNAITTGIGNAAALGAFTPTGYAAYEAATGTTRRNNEFLFPGGVLSNEYAYVESYDYTFTAGLAYAFSPVLSVAAAARYVVTDKEVDIRGTYTYSGSDTQVRGKYDQEADGFGGVFSINIRPTPSVNLAIRYETKVKLDWENSVDAVSIGTVGENILWMNDRVDGAEYARDLPAVLGAGIEWYITPALAICPSYTLYFEKDADWGEDMNNEVDENSWDLALALRYDFNPQWTGTIGYMYTSIGLEPQDYSIIENMSPALDCHTLALGSRYKINDKFTLTMGAMGNFYEADTAEASGTTPQTEYDKQVYVVSLGLQYKIL